jgi:hypothetical protein
MSAEAQLWQLSSDLSFLPLPSFSPPPQPAAKVEVAKAAIEMAVTVRVMSIFMSAALWRVRPAVQLEKVAGGLEKRASGAKFRLLL